jgi:multiple antibiotic resistance protein
LTLWPAASAAFLLAFPTLFSIVNPPTGAIIFNQATAERSHAERLELARRVGFNSALVMLVSLWGGSYILSFFGITLNALRIAGGIVVAIRAYQMLSAPEAHEERKQAQASAVAAPVKGSVLDDVSAIAFFPLTLPFTTGPGTISVAIALGTERPEYGGGLLGFFLGASCAALAIALLIWIFYAMADRLGGFLGPAGRQAVTRLAAFLLLGIGVQIIVSGAIPVLHTALGG